MSKGNVLVTFDSSSDSYEVIFSHADRHSFSFMLWRRSFQITVSTDCESQWETECFADPAENRGSSSKEKMSSWDFPCHLRARFRELQFRKDLFDPLGTLLERLEAPKKSFWYCFGLKWPIYCTLFILPSKAKLKARSEASRQKLKSLIFLKRKIFRRELSLCAYRL